MRSRSLAGATASLLLLALAACGSSTADPAANSTTPAGEAATGAAFPVTIQHALGSTTIESKPERVATVAWSNHEVPLALGVVPVGMSKATWGDDNGNGVLPWVEEKLTELGAQTPVLFDDTDSIDYEAVANTKPDVILAAYSGLTKEQYDTLSKIAPVVAYPKAAWGTSMDEMIKLNSLAIGLGPEGEKLATDLDAQVKATGAKHPELAGKTALFSFIDTTDLSKVGFYNTNDPRAALFTEIGMTEAKAATESAAAGPAFFGTISAEQSDSFADVDLVVSYAKDEAATLKAVEADPLWSKIPAVKNGSIALLKDDTPLAAVANPSPLSIPWGMDKYLAVLDAAATKAP
ncbi:iron complex transport system substrate-binding protein [Kineosphaera limosa]|uniref:Putative iron-siderophore ABC transporter substrate-binding protein n=1 Tax=Kineosphaera limosa NBRC 100340 TaxID=1184609 RepID=K6X7X5_9MICO|nr:iron-siderophore ABC transporter substrate-binding protein [Kineosphaera limosa]NYE00905.1 iron complex transport system substrate-binding protein [Kineosphaera limosa]GAB94899.1 putative iron-siderophore ABC transporter substrate-binding protein [Kineosphaera limosa NBRC 100340]